METPPRPPASLRAPFAEPPPLRRSLRAPATREPADTGEWMNRIDDVARADARSGRRDGSVVLEETEPYQGATDSLSQAEKNRLLRAYNQSYDAYTQRGGFRRRSQTARFNRCVKGVRQTVKPRPKSTAESAAIAICTKTLLHRKGRTLKKYRKGKRLITQKRKD